MKRQTVILILSLLALNLFAQEERQASNRKLTDLASANLAYIGQYTEIQGSPFISDKWVNGKLLLENKEIIAGIQLKFDAYANKFLVNMADTAYEVNPSVKEVYLYPSTDTEKVLVFKSGFAINSKITASKYLQVLAEGKITLLKFLQKDLEEYLGYGDATKRKRFNESVQYFIKSNGQYKSIKLSKASLEDLLGDKWTEVSSFLSQKKLNGKDEKSFVEAIQFYNSL